MEIAGTATFCSEFGSWDSSAAGEPSLAACTNAGEGACPTDDSAGAEAVAMLGTTGTVPTLDDGDGCVLKATG